MFKKLTDTEGNPVYVNLEHVVTIFVDKNKTTNLTFDYAKTPYDNSVIQVKELPQQILKIQNSFSLAEEIESDVNI